MDIIDNLWLGNIDIVRDTLKHYIFITLDTHSLNYDTFKQ